LPLKRHRTCSRFSGVIVAQVIFSHSAIVTLDAPKPFVNPKKKASLSPLLSVSQ
jgi:hypothetical protein